ncbi:TlpA disulfide reductase family protein [Mesoflavibacter sp. CH_XMU1404-2]|uniref:peroxiredoxin family protein n=1 Tax=Mesoflavibacter sp. CH_XMU1404-2 TaxID=3107766 RepID=UPI00300969F8
MRQITLLLITILVFSCKQEQSTKFLTADTYRAQLQVDDNTTLPFLFKVKDANTLEIYNAEEVITVDEIEYKNDSVFIQMPVFESYIKVKIQDQTLTGQYITEGKDRSVPFTAAPAKTRFETTEKPNTTITGNWETTFSPNTDDSYKAKGIFTQNGNTVTGTFRTETGDYRYLDGVINGDQMHLSTFDGSHAFLFTATVTDSILYGTFYSGNHWKEPFTAKRNDNFTLADANSLTYLKDGYETLTFTFPDENGNLISLTDDRFKNKVVVVQIMGTWCPNCLDESNYYAQYYNNNKDKDIEFVALAFEYAKTEETAFKNIKRLKDRVGINYPILLAQTGTTSKSKANEKLPMLNHVLSYPTSIFIDKTGKVRKIHTGFNGPATGDKFTEFKTEFTSFVDGLLAE